ncbi:MAG: hypothetical protein P9M03_01725 [Candidatus Theseobacter exili]|nr:hypothetical protein [Candidatus Theseobacter exili]
MAEKITVKLPGGIEKDFTCGISLREIINSVPGESSVFPLAVLVNNCLEDLDYVLNEHAQIEWVDYSSKEGASVYRRSASIILLEATADVCPEADLVVGQSISKGYYYSFKSKEPLNEDILDRISSRMWEIVREDRSFNKTNMTLQDAIDFFEKKGRVNKVRLLKTLTVHHVWLICCGNFVDIYNGPVAPSTGEINQFQLTMHGRNGFILRFPNPDMKTFPDNISQPGLFNVYQETRSWYEILKVENVGQLNELSINDKISEVVKIAEGLHEKKIAQIADEIYLGKDSIRIILIAGPSSSGKTTFSKRLGIQLKVNGITPVSLSLDHYFKDRQSTPKDSLGNFNFDVLEAIDLDLLHQQLQSLLEGKEVQVPFYSFTTGERVSGKSHKLSLKKDIILIIEGIHAMNPKLVAALPDEVKYRIYVSALTQLAIDDHNRIFTSDTRLIRRIIRDCLFRGYSAWETIKQWPSVREGENSHIFPFQEEANVMFNSALVYEHAVLRNYAERFLLDVPRSRPEYAEARRLLSFISVFVPISPDEVPPTSILREFIGESGFEY